MSTLTAEPKQALFTREEILERINYALMDHDLWEWGWSAKVGSAKKQLGSCNYRTKTICISLPLANITGEEGLDDTILHEVAHALAGSQAGHGPLWKAVCREIGANPNRTAKLNPVQLAETYKWESRCAICESHGDGRKRRKHHRRGKLRCGYCSKERELTNIIEYRSLADPVSGWSTF